MVEPIENLKYDAFDRAHSALWRTTMFQFDQDKENIELDTKAFIDTSFKKLRSAEGRSTAKYDYCSYLSMQLIICISKDLINCNI